MHDIAVQGEPRGLLEDLPEIGLLQAGLRIDEFPGMLHAKAMLIDDDTVLIGSANLDTRSFRLNFELSTCVTDHALNRQLARLFETLQAQAHTVSSDDLRLSSYLARLRDGVAHLLSPLL